MVAKCFLLLSLLAAVAYGQTVNELRLPDQTTVHLSNPLIPKTISIPLLILDKLISCHVIFPNGASYEIFPNYNVPQSQYIQTHAGGAFDSCGMGFRNAPPEYSGTYELLGLVENTFTAPDTRTLNMQRFHLEFYYSDSWQIPSEN